MDKSDTRKSSLMNGYVPLIVAVLLWSTLEVVTKLLLPHVGAMEIAFYRFIIPGIFFILISYKKILKIKRKHWKNILFSAVFGLTLSMGFYSIALKYVPAEKAAVIFSMNPVFAAIFAVFLLSEKLTSKKIIGLIIGLCGVYIVVYGFHIMKFTGMFGILLTILAAIFFGLFIVSGKKMTAEYGTIPFFGICFLIAGLIYIPMVKHFTVTDPLYSIPLLIYMIIGISCGAYILYWRGLGNVSVAAGGSSFYLKPIFATVFAILILGSHIDFAFIIGLIIILSGLSLTMIPSKNKIKN